MLLAWPSCSPQEGFLLQGHLEVFPRPYALMQMGDSGFPGSLPSAGFFFFFSFAAASGWGDCCRAGLLRPPEKALGEE